MKQTIAEFLARCLLVDIEINEKNVIYSLGAVMGEKVFRSLASRPVSLSVLAELNEFGKNAHYLLGHNILSHDIPKLKELAPDLEILAKPAIDTLYLSPLAYPANPYHRLVKDYQLVRDSVSDPVEDANLAGRVFAEQWQAFAGQLAESSDIPMLYRSFLHTDAHLTGTTEALAAMGVPLLENDDLYEAFGWFARKHACATAVDRLVEQLYDGTAGFDRPLLAYVVAWLSVAGGNSVLPPWVRHHFPHVSVLLHSLRENSCDDPGCGYCREHHDPRAFLNRFFGFDDFRPQPATVEGKSLQGEVVTAGARNGTLFATLPTGGGKSLCYLLPALMRYQRRNLLTIVLSPLQALMKDQVDNFSKQTGTRLAAALYGMLTMPERGEVMDGVRLGDIGILYVSPEQLRNRSFVETISQREVGAWVFDEAHCLSKWGHDFRPDYFYAIRFIREFATRNGVQVPPVQCFTATAKRDVKAEIVDTIQSELGLRVSRFEGGHERTNLHYEVFSVTRHEKRQTILQLLQERYTGKGCVVIYCATKKNTERLAEFLHEAGYTAEAFHAGLDPSLKKRVLEQFIAGEIPVICATNAFGMGIDKDDVRLVLHADIPGSLENYLQEAGRAGRDRQDAECILVFDEQDIEKQFQLSSMSRLTKREIAQMLRGIRAASRGNTEVVLTAGELLKREEVDIDADIRDGDTRVRTAVAWLERAGFLLRNENNTKVFQGKILVRDLEEAARKIAELGLSARQRERWLDILHKLMSKEGTTSGFSADELASCASFATAEGDGRYETESQRVLRTLHDMAEQGLLAKEMTLSAYIRYKVKDNSSMRLQQIGNLEQEFLNVLNALAPDVELNEPLELNLRQVNQLLVDKGYAESTCPVLKNLLYGLARDGRGLAGQTGSIGLTARGNNCFVVYLHRSWESILATMRKRQQAAAIALQVIQAGVKPEAKPNANLLAEFTLESIVEGLKGDLLLFSELKKPLAVAERALTFMHEQRVIELQQGLAVFRQAMTLQLTPDTGGRRQYTIADFSPLKTHYTERNFQIHVMNEYARKALEKISTAMRLVASYFNDDKEDFVQRYFPEKKKVLERATSEQSYTRIVDDLKNKAQAAIVAAHAEKNMLVLAGPGSGKTRVVTHRVAYLLRVERVNPSAILVLCFNRSAIMSLRKKLQELVGADMDGVTTLTFHGLALRLTGRSVAVSTERKVNGEIDFTKVITDAVRLLKGETEAIGLGSDSVRDTLVGRFSHILVDEYQDIDEEQYELVSLLAGKSIAEQDQKLTILAVGDDDQNIYRFRGANVGFIRRFQEDYQAEKHYLIENYRSTAHIIAAANQLIRHNTDRMKTVYPIRINEARRMLPAGGNRQINDSLTRGKVQILQVAGVHQQAFGLLEELRRLQGVEGGFDLDSCAVLAREWKELDLIRSVLEANAIPVNLHWGRGGGFPGLHWIRENAQVLDYLRERKNTSLSGSSLLELLPADASGDNIWQANLRRLVYDWMEETSNALQPVPLIEEYLYEAFADQRRSRNLGRGIFLSTIHSVKGLEFDHVFLLGEHWEDLAEDEGEEERRLYYVAMTRARETLQLFRIDGLRNPHVEAIFGKWAVQRKLNAVCEFKKPVIQHALLGMEGLYLDFAGVRRETHPARLALARLNVGDPLHFDIQNDNLGLLNSEGVSVARLSRTAREHWWPLLSRIEGVRILAMVRRHRSMSEEKYQERYHGETWEVPMVEVEYR